MQHRTEIELARHAVRSKICPRCYQRPEGSEVLGPAVPRNCESRCTIFMSLGKLLSAIEDVPADAAPDGIMRNKICGSCNASASAGDYCAEGLARICPLSRYGADVLMILEDLHRIGSPRRPDSQTTRQQ
jgi:hypothetical protein